MPAERLLCLMGCFPFDLHGLSTSSSTIGLWSASLLTPVFFATSPVALHVCALIHATGGLRIVSCLPFLVVYWCTPSVPPPLPPPHSTELVLLLVK